MSFVKLVSHAIAVTALTALLVDCGGSGGGNSVAPARNAGGGTAAQSVVVTVNIPGRTPAGVRRTKYVGTGTQSAVFSVTLAGSTPAPNVTANCTTTCQATLSVLPGSNTFAVSLYDAANGSGNLLSTGSATQTIVAGTNTVNLTFNGNEHRDGLRNRVRRNVHDQQRHVHGPGERDDQPEQRERPERDVHDHRPDVDVARTGLLVHVLGRHEHVDDHGQRELAG